MHWLQLRPIAGRCAAMLSPRRAKYTKETKQMLSGSSVISAKTGSLLLITRKMSVASAIINDTANTLGRKMISIVD